MPIQIVFAGQAEAAGWQIASSEVHTVVVREDGTLWAWGSYKYGQLGDGTDGMDSNLPYAEIIRTTPTQIGTDDDWKAVAVGHFYSIALKEDGTLWAWGSNMYGQHGDDTDGRGTPYVHNIKNTPTKIGTDENWAAIWAGEYHTVALKDNGTLWAWGANGSGQLGLGHTGVANVPTQVGTDNKWTSVSLGHSHSVALKSDNTLWAWGGNWFGQLGAGLPPSDVSSLTQIGTNEWVAVAAGDYHTIAQKIDGKLWAWGRNTAGQLGVGYSSDASAFLNEPIIVAGDNDNSNWAVIDAGVHFTVALKSDATFWAWGSNGYGQHGDGTTSGKHTPAQIFDSASGWVAIASGSTSNSTFALKSDGTLWAWGSNGFGQLGDGTTENRLTPVAIYIAISEYNLTVNSANPTAGVAIESSTGHDGNTAYSLSLAPGTSVTLTAPEYHGSGASRKKFQNWSGAVSNTNRTITLPMDADKTVAANYQNSPVPAKVTLNRPFHNATVEGTYYEFQWNAASGATKYQLQLRHSSNDTIFKTITLGNVLKRSLFDLPADGTQLRWRVRAGNANGWGEWSSYRTFTNSYGAFNTNFNSTNGYQGWIRRPQSSWNLTSAAMQTAGQANRYVSARRGNVYYRNLDYSVRMRRTNSNLGEQYLVIRAGTKYAASGLWHPGYAFGYRNNGTYRVIRLNNNGTITQLKGWTASNKINKGGFNTLRVRAVNNNLRFFINGTQVHQLNNRTFARGTVGVMMFRRGADPASTRLLVDWAKLTNPVVSASGTAVDVLESEIEIYEEE